MELSLVVHSFVLGLNLGLNTDMCGPNTLPAKQQTRGHRSAPASCPTPPAGARRWAWCALSSATSCSRGLGWAHVSRRCDSISRAARSSLLSPSSLWRSLLQESRNAQRVLAFMLRCARAHESQLSCSCSMHHQLDVCPATGVAGMLAQTIWNPSEAVRSHSGRNVTEPHLPPRAQS
jgi:hypothetical protein